MRRRSKPAFISILLTPSNYYFNVYRDKKELDSPIYNSFYKLIRHHLGTAAFGSLLIAFIKFIRTILSVFQVSSYYVRSILFEVLFQIFNSNHLHINEGKLARI